jgi:SAM-dependent methyltransferase
LRNIAKVYCLNWVERALLERDGSVSILDVGCGTATHFIPLLKKYPNLCFVGVEPFEPSYRQAVRNLEGLNARVIQMYGYKLFEALGEKFDFVVSFSTFEHVYRRKEYLNAVKKCLKPEGQFLINYDAGHFVAPVRKDKMKNIIGPILARFGIEQYYQSFVHEGDFQRMVQNSGLKIIDQKFFNTRLKGIAHGIPRDQEAEFIQRWYDLEMWLNESGLTYNDAQAASFFTRNFVLKHA